jgi:hypothetical protein
MKRKNSFIGILFCMVFFLPSCGSTPSSSSNSGNVKITFTTSTLSSALLAKKGSFLHTQAVGSGTNCSVTVESTTTTGKCYTPLKVKGFFDRASLASTSGGTPVRVLGGGSKYSGFQDIFRHEAFDLSSTVTIDGDDNIQDGTSSSYNLMTMRVQSLEYQIEAVVGGTTKFYTVRNFFSDSKPSTSTLLTDCSLSSGELTEADTYGDLYSGITAKRGDLMVCIKTTSSATCAASDFVWVDSSGTTYSTRPASPLQLTGTYFGNTPSCSQSSGSPAITWGSSELTSALASGVSVTASISGGTKTYTVNGSSGTQLNVAIDIVATDSLFIPSSATDVTNLSSVASESIFLQNLNKILLKPVFKNNNRTSAADTGDSTLSSSVTLTIQ